MNIDKDRLHELIQQKILGQKVEEELYKSYHHLVYQIAFSVLKNKENAEDVMQNVFAKLVEMPKEKLPTTKETSWLYSVTKNEALNYFRKNKKEIPVEEIYEWMDENTQINEMIEKEDYQKLIRWIRGEGTRNYFLKGIIKIKF